MLCAYFDVKPPPPRKNAKPKASDPSVKVHAAFVPLPPEKCAPMPSMAAARSAGAPLDEDEPLPGFDGEYYYCNEEDEDLKNIDDELENIDTDYTYVLPEDDSVTVDDTSSLEDDLKWPLRGGKSHGAALYSGPELFCEDDDFID